MASDPKAEGMNRRQFLFLTAAALAGAGCNTVENSGSYTVSKERMINAGPVGDYAADGVYDRFRNDGFFVVRRSEKLFVLSSFCTHRKCKLNAESDHSFYCKCHGSTFDPDGNVTTGPAKRNLPIFPAFLDEHGQLLVRVSAG